MKILFGSFKSSEDVSVALFELVLDPGLLSSISDGANGRDDRRKSDDRESDQFEP